MKRFGLAVLLCALGVHAWAADEKPAKLVRVTGTAEVKVIPDRAVIDVGVEKEDASAVIAKRSADTATRRLLAALKQNGIADKDVQTSYLSLQPQQHKVKGITVRTFAAGETLTITVRDLSRLDGLLEALIKAGGNQIDSLRYETSDLRKYRDQAREMAVKAAHEKAEALAKALGQEIGKASSIEETNTDAVFNYGYNALAGVDYKTTREPSIAVGQKSISASVTVAFDLI